MIAPSTDPAATPFRDALATQGMRSMLGHWVACRAGTALPQRPPFDPLHLPHELKNIQLHERHAGDRYFCRVSGTHIVQVLGFESSNRYVDEVIGAVHVKSRTALLNEALDGGRPLYYGGTLAAPGTEWRGMKRLLLPFMKGEMPCLLSLVRYLTETELQLVTSGPAYDGGGGIAMKLVISEDEIAVLRTGV